MRIDKRVGARWLQAVALGRDRALSADGRAAVTARLAVSMVTRVIVRMALVATAPLESAGRAFRRHPARHTVEVRNAHCLGFGEWSEGSAIADRLGTDTFTLFSTGVTVEIATSNAHEWIIDGRGPVFRLEPDVHSERRHPRRRLRTLDGYDLRLLMKRGNTSDPSTWG